MRRPDVWNHFLKKNKTSRKNLVPKNIKSLLYQENKITFFKLLENFPFPERFSVIITSSIKTIKVWANLPRHLNALHYSVIPVEYRKQSISCQSSHFIPPENARKPKDFGVFRVYKIGTLASNGLQ